MQFPPRGQWKLKTEKNPNAVTLVNQKMLLDVAWVATNRTGDKKVEIKEDFFFLFGKQQILDCHSCCTEICTQTTFLLW